MIKRKRNFLDNKKIVIEERALVVELIFASKRAESIIPGRIQKHLF